ncbi:MAG: Lrp/AsnC ligand binding domain-containing protein [Euryarchaeota archaeon]|nr:Lrp/AsnC ligand binding domain-containing protein [Euryarchaeota archaeon]
MPAIGYILIDVQAGTERDVFYSLQGVEEVSEVFPLFGQFDFIAKVEATDFNVLGQIVVARIRSIPGVRSTQTLTVTRL